MSIALRDFNLSVFTDSQDDLGAYIEYLKANRKAVADGIIDLVKLVESHEIAAKAFHEIRISKALAVYLIANDLHNVFHLEVMNKEYGDNDDWSGLMNEDVVTIIEGDEYQTFEIWLAGEHENEQFCSMVRFLKIQRMIHFTEEL